MKEGIHPNYVSTLVTCGCGNKFQTRSTRKEIKVDKNGNLVDEGVKPVPVKADEMNTGGRGGSQMQAGKDYKLGRQYGMDEKYLVVNADGEYRILDSPDELKDLYKDIGSPW